MRAIHPEAKRPCQDSHAAPRIQHPHQPSLTIKNGTHDRQTYAHALFECIASGTPAVGTFTLYIAQMGDEKSGFMNCLYYGLKTRFFAQSSLSIKDSYKIRRECIYIALGPEATEQDTRRRQHYLSQVPRHVGNMATASHQIRDMET